MTSKVTVPTWRREITELFSRTSFSWVEVVPVMVMMVYLIKCPYTKVEESFGMQAMHDILYERNISRFDHLTYSGVVPRTFLGPLGIAAASAIPVGLWSLITTNCTRIHALYITRSLLGLLHCLGLIWVGRETQRLFGKTANMAFLLLTSIQFHQLYYASRPLGNSFALVGFLAAFAMLLSGEQRPQSTAVSVRLRGFKVLAFSATVFRADLAVLILPLLLYFLVSRRLPLVETCKIGIVTGLKSILLSGIIDSIFWGRILWPEGEVLYFNVVLNKSHEWGVMPFHWYFTRALPKSLLMSYPVFPFAAYAVKELRPFTLSVIGYLLLYSLLPHKELRFIFYALPVVNLASAVFLSRLVVGVEKLGSAIRNLTKISIALSALASLIISSVLLSVSSTNYPGGEALLKLHEIRPKGGTVHIDVLPSMAGVTRFQKNYCGGWTYDKTPGLKIDPVSGKLVDFHLTFDPDNYTSQGYRPILNITSFVSADMPRIKNLDLWPLPAVYNTTAFVVEISSTASSQFQRYVTGNELGS
eukprot:TRINITY_DN4962_c0_g1_i1.p1 TRINITY_DN4962_c0_g1~~TRINITY_DN4962_c0_g1_i1.p1  ORF type:complete len:530 (+),score=48.21 TRINITY_DN4962_c0_g1_i1:81-1670(+)